MSGKLLVVEDQLSILDSILERAYREHMECAVDMTGENGLKKAKSIRPDLIFLDMDIASGCGDRFLYQIKNDAQLHNIPIVFISRVAQGDEVFKKMERATGDEYIVNNKNLEEFFAFYSWTKSDENGPDFLMM